MNTADFILSDDAWLLTTENDALVASVSQPLTMPSTVRTTLDWLEGGGLAGVFMAAAEVDGLRDFFALVVQEGVIYLAEGAMSDTGGDLSVIEVTLTMVTGGDTAVAPYDLVMQNYDDGGATLQWSYSTVDQDTVVSDDPLPWEEADIGGSILWCPPEMMDLCTAHFTVVRAYPGIDALEDTEHDLAALASEDAVGTVDVTTEPRVHVIVGAQLGDLEMDIGKSVPWVSKFASTVFITDINLGNPRYWVIDWARTFRQAKSISLGIDYFTAPAAWREAQFVAADAAWNYADDDWVLFIDGHEGLSCDTSDPPDDATVHPFGSYLNREVQRAIDLDSTMVSIPFHAFVRVGTITEIETRPEEVVDDVVVPASVVDVGAPYYHQPGSGGMVRLVKVSELRAGFVWDWMDELSLQDADVAVQIISYGYAKWVNPETSVDDGAAIRAKMSQVVPIGGLPVVGSDVSGVLGPSATGPGTGASAELLTPMYASVFRDNPRDGVWYVGDESPAGGFVPLNIIVNVTLPVASSADGGDYGAELSVTDGTWDGSPNLITYLWGFADGSGSLPPYGTPVIVPPGTTPTPPNPISSTYTPQLGDYAELAGQDVRCYVTAYEYDFDGEVVLQEVIAVSNTITIPT